MSRKPGANEFRLIEAIESSQIADFSGDASGVGRDRRLDAGILHDILFGLPIELLTESPPRAAVIPTTGFRVKGAVIHGVLSLEDLASVDGGAFPRLEFESCQFDSTINLARCHVRGLSLKDCAFKTLICTDAAIDGPVDLSRAHPPRPGEFGEDNDAAADRKAPSAGQIDRIQEEAPGAADGIEKCWVVFAGTNIAGRFNAAYAKFVSPAKREIEKYAPFSRHARFALDLRATQIQGSVTLRPDVSAFGGVCLDLARINGSVWSNGAIFTAVEDCAFSADYARIHGSIYMRPFEEKGKRRVRLEATGCIRLFAATIGGSVYLGGAKLQPQGKSGYPTVGDEHYHVFNATNAVIGGDCRLNCWQSEVTPEIAYRLEATGDVVLQSMRIRGDLLLSGAVFKKKIMAGNIDVGGHCRLSGVSYPTEHFYPSVEEGIDFSGGHIKGDLDMGGAQLGGEQKVFVLNAANAKIGGNCRLCAFGEKRAGAVVGIPFSCRGSISMPEAAIGNSLLMEGARLFGPEKEPALDLSGTTIGGDAKLWTWSPEGARTGMPFEMSAGIVGLRLSGTKITQKLNLNGARLSASKVVIHAANIEVGGKASLGTHVVVRPDVQAPFSFHSEGLIILTSASIKLGLDMSGAYIVAPEPQWGSKQATEANIPHRKRTSMVLDLTLARVKFVSLCECPEIHSKNPKKKMKAVPFEAVGKVSLQNAEIDTELNLTNGCFRGPLTAAYARIGTSLILNGTHLWSGSTDGLLRRTGTDFLGRPVGRIYHVRSRVQQQLLQKHVDRKLPPDLSFHAARVGSKLTVKNLMRCDQDEGTPGHRDELSHATIDLRGLHVEELEDDGGQGWVANGWADARVRLWLDGFRYKRLPEVAIKPRKPSLWEFIRTIWHRTFDASWQPEAHNSVDSAYMGKDEAGSVHSLDTGEDDGASEELLDANNKDESGSVLPLEIAEQEKVSEGAPNMDIDELESKPVWKKTLRWIYGLVENNGPWQDRQHWLNLQYFEQHNPQKSEFSPDAYQQMVDSLNSTGNYEDARRIASARMTLEKKLRHNWVSRRPWWFLRVFFDYGFSGVRAFITFALCIAMGWGMVHIANYGLSWWPGIGKALIINTTPPQGVVVEDEHGNATSIYAQKGALEAVHKGVLPSCGKRIRSILYALDVFVPVLDLHQQEACSISPDRPGWRYAQAIYALLGWALTPLAILTVTGILRRHLEK